MKNKVYKMIRPNGIYYNEPFGILAINKKFSKKWEFLKFQKLSDEEKKYFTRIFKNKRDREIAIPISGDVLEIEL